jgi:twitching motility protein PilT
MSETFQIESKETLFEVLYQLVKLRVSDIFITARKPLEIRMLGDVLSTSHIAPSEDVMVEFLNSAGDVKISGLLSDPTHYPAGQIDGAVSLPGDAGASQRFRYNFFRMLDPISKHQTVKLALRPLSDKIPTTDELLIPKRLVEDMDAMKQGLILVCGKAGQGKSTSLASLLQHRAEKFKHHIVTLEQPIEYILQSNKSSISQREIGVSTDSFAGGLRAALRQSPDLILVGEIRDRETAEIALSAAESGHLVFGTLHTSNAAQSIERFVNIFPTEAQPSVWNVLSSALRAIICQILVRDTEGHRVAVREIMLVNTSISSYIKKQDIQGVRRGIESGFNDYGMVNWARAAEQLMQQGIISEATQKELTALGE